MNHKISKAYIPTNRSNEYLKCLLYTKILTSVTKIDTFKTTELLKYSSSGTKSLLYR